MFCGPCESGPGLTRSVLVLVLVVVLVVLVVLVVVVVWICIWSGRSQMVQSNFDR